MNEMEVEEWRPIPEWHGYEVSNTGRVRSIERTVIRRTGRPMSVRPRILSQVTRTDGYPSVFLCRTEDRGTRRYVHQLVLEAFVGPRPDKMECRHLDGDRLNPHVTNLAWGTRSQNTQDRVRHGTHHNANKTHCPKGHRYDEINTRWGAGGKSRWCRACEKMRVRK